VNTVAALVMVAAIVAVALRGGRGARPFAAAAAGVAVFLAVALVWVYVLFSGFVSIQPVVDVLRRAHLHYAGLILLYWLPPALAGFCVVLALRAWAHRRLPRG
jgi:hypothetical protein